MKLISSLFLLFTLSLISCIRLNDINPTVKLSNKWQIGLGRITSRVNVLKADTSCKVAAKFALILLSNVKSKSDLRQIKLGKSIQETLERMKSMLLREYVLQVEINTNHHFILFIKNKTELYLVQAFYTYYRLEDWLLNKTLMKPYLTIDAFFEKLAALLDNDTPIDLRNKMIIELFLPKVLIDDEEKRRSMINYFKGKVSLVKVDYAPYNFSIYIKGNAFKKRFDDLDQHFFI